MNRGLHQFKQLPASLMALKQKGSVDLLANATSWLFLHEKPPDAVRKTLQKMARKKSLDILESFFGSPAEAACQLHQHCRRTLPVSLPRPTMSPNHNKIVCRCYNQEPQRLPTRRKHRRHSLRPNSRTTPRLPWKHTLPLPPARRIAHHLPYNGIKQHCAVRPRGQSKAPSRPLPRRP